jgi:hypothetical protein
MTAARLVLLRDVSVVEQAHLLVDHAASHVGINRQVQQLNLQP